MASTLTEKDQQLLVYVAQCFDGGGWPKIDYKKLHGLSGHKTPASATTAWHNIRKKVEAMTPLTTKDQQLLVNVTQCLERGTWPKIDYVKLHSLSGHKTAASAATAWHNIRKKIEAGQTDVEGTADGGDGAAAAGGSDEEMAEVEVEKTLTKKAGGRKRGAKVAGAGGEDELAQEASPKKRGRKAKVEPVDDEAGHDAEVPAAAPKKRAGRPSKKDKEAALAMVAVADKESNEQTVKSEPVGEEVNTDATEKKIPAPEPKKKPGRPSKKDKKAVAAAAASSMPTTTVENTTEPSVGVEVELAVTAAEISIDTTKEKTPTPEASTDTTEEKTPALEVNKRGRGRPKKGSTPAVETVDDKAAGDQTVENTNEPSAQIEVNIPVADAEVIINTTKEKTPAPDAVKRGRGRPKKTPTPAVENAGEKDGAGIAAVDTPMADTQAEIEVAMAVEAGA
ncbi:hypothetical protein LTR62_003375 [Meristemomyces frigidus]|uniref:Uncharacterized protein n=1 Tax=Meristemomyces frigidus TaxID=1508187 RepID=A0AAN7TPJ4_9PEZI|nr:hypothetical protein LTR62_003375 [Meristemomyces frigidus]